jgi:copper homeostasis protein
VLIGELVRAADGRVVVMPGSGVRSANIAELAAKTGAVEFHTSARVRRRSAMEFVNGPMQEDLSVTMADEEEVRLIKEEFERLRGDGGSTSTL